MLGRAGTLDDRVVFGGSVGRRNTSSSVVIVPLGIALFVFVATGIAYSRLENVPPVVTTRRAAPISEPVRRSPPPPARVVAAAPPFDSALLYGSYSLGATPAPFGENAPRVADFITATPAQSVAFIVAPAPIAPIAAAIELAEAIPLPAPRPPALQILSPSLPRAPQPRLTAAIKPPVEAEGTLFDRLFRARPPEPALAYAAPETNLFGGVGRATFNPTAAYGTTTAVYDISAHTVYLPNGTRLEAHSGLGNRLDDPRYVAEQNRGPTPPHLYDLQPREQLFHGVAALRLNPVGGGGIFGRTGLLAHTYMLGPNGDSNGCVSFSNYRAFLAAYQRGEVRRLAVVARLN